jgi:hypothetical protein
MEAWLISYAMKRLYGTAIVIHIGGIILNAYIATFYWRYTSYNKQRSNVALLYGCVSSQRCQVFLRRRVELLTYLLLL